MKFVQNRITLITDNRTTIFAILMFILLHCGAWQLYAQEWTEPVNVSNGSSFIYQPDMIIDSNGTIHLVWCHVLATNFSKLFYSFSNDDGETWAEPNDILQNTNIRMNRPHITIDQRNSIFVAYDYGVGTTNRYVNIVINDGTGWSEPVTISEGMNGSHYNYIITDNNDRIYVFWDYSPTGDDYYRYLENGIWSEPFCPYPGNDEIYALLEAKVSADNSLHWVGGSASGNYYGIRLKYFYFDSFTGFWHPPVTPVTDTILADGRDIDINGIEILDVVYRKKFISLQSGTDLTALIKKEGSNWNMPEIVAHETGMQSYQRIAIDQNNDIHIVENIYQSNDSKLVHYHLSDEIWIYSVIDQSANFCHPTKLLYYNKKLYMIYFKNNIGGYQTDGDIFFTKYDILTHIPEVKHKPAALQVFPNPASHSVTIAFELEQQQHVAVSVLDIAGKPIKQVINTVLPSGAHSFTWNGTDHSCRPVKSGTYLVQLQTKQVSTTQTVEIAR